MLVLPARRTKVGFIRWRTRPMTTQSIIFGYHADDTVNRKEAAIVRMIFYMYVVCELSHERIAFHLNRLRIACPEAEWTDLLIYEILTNPVYIGQGPAPDILQDIEAWEIAQQSVAPVHSTPV